MRDMGGCGQWGMGQKVQVVLRAMWWPDGACTPEAIPTSCDMARLSYCICSPGVLLPNGPAIPTAQSSHQACSIRLFISSCTPLGCHAFPLVSQAMFFLQERKEEGVDSGVSKDSMPDPWVQDIAY